MEDESAPILNDNKETDTSKEVAESIPVQTQKDDLNGNPGYLVNSLQVNTGGLKSRDSGSKGAPQGDEGPYAEFNMEAAISSDDVMRAGGFGARDGISSVLPVASDSTDFEASLLDARGYEDPQTEIQRPGLGYTK